MNRTTLEPATALVNRQGASVLLSETFAFLLRNGISAEFIANFSRQYIDPKKPKGDIRRYRKLVSDYEDMGMIMSTWYSRPRFLDESGQPLPLSIGRGPRSVASLIQISRVRISTSRALELMRRSPSIELDTQGSLGARKRTFVLPEFEIPRAALVIERYLDTLRRNSAGHKSKTSLLLERNCRVPEVDLATIAPVLRDIKGRGAALIDSIDGEIERHRLRRSKRKGVGEVGLLIFSWTRPRNSRSKARRI
jgi:hypothetical protein